LVVGARFRRLKKEERVRGWKYKGPKEIKWAKEKEERSYLSPVRLA